ncbi:MAG: response regulator transcription factor [Flavobacteriales bacterium]
MPIRVSIVEDDEILLDAFAAAVLEHPALELVGRHLSAEPFVAAIGSELPHVVIMDIGLPGISGIETLLLLKPKFRDVQFVMCTVQDDDDSLFRAICAGATGYLVKNASPVQLITAVQEVHAGGSPMSAGIARRVLANLRPTRTPAPEIAQLTERERQVLEELAQGYRYKEIAERLTVSMDTVRTHIRNLYHKLQVSSRTDALNKLDGR